MFADGTYGDGLNNVAGTVKGLLYGDPSQLVAQIVGTVTNLGFIFGASWVFFKVMDAVMGMRVSPEVELEASACRRWVPTATRRCKARRPSPTP